MKFLIANYSCLQNHLQGGYRPPDPRSLCPQLNLSTPPKKIPGYATVLDVGSLSVCTRLIAL